MSAISGGSNKAECLLLIENLLDETRLHFQAEEEILSVKKYPLTSEHHRIHLGLLAKAAELSAKFTSNELTMGELFTFLANDIIWHHMLYFVDTNRVITYWNKAAERISCFTAAEVVGSSCADKILTHVDGAGTCLCTGLCPLAASIADGVNREAEDFLHHKDGHRVLALVRVSLLKDPAGKVIGGIELFTDISNIQTNTLRVQELEKLAILDNLTQLANRNYIERELQARFEEHKRMKIPFGILFIDIDHFKKVNDTYGHDVGDAVLRFVARTFIANSRPFDLWPLGWRGISRDHP